jgi:hypothetical protein
MRTDPDEDGVVQVRVTDLVLVEDEVLELTTLLESAVADLSPEIADTDNPHYRALLRRRRELLRAIHGKLDASRSNTSRSVHPTN